MTADRKPTCDCHLLIRPQLACRMFSIAERRDSDCAFHLGTAPPAAGCPAAGGAWDTAPPPLAAAVEGFDLPELGGGALIAPAASVPARRAFVESNAFLLEANT